MSVSRRAPLTLAVLLLLLVLAVGCSSADLEFIPTGGEYTRQEAQDAAAAIDIEPVRDVTSADAPEMRSERLESLRSNGTEASALADALTRDFPSETAAVPLRVEAASVDGVDVWLVFEAWGDEGGTLTHRRLWILDREALTVIGSSSFR